MGTAIGNQQTFGVDGYSYTASMYNQTLCLTPQTLPLAGYFCTAANTPFYGVSDINGNTWNYMSPAFAGVIGFG